MRRPDSTPGEPSQLHFNLHLFATAILLTYMETFSFMAGVAADPSADLGLVRNASPAVHAVLAMLVLLVAASSAAACVAIERRPRFDYSFVRFSNCAFTATITVLADISTAPRAGVSKMPHAAITPAASGMAKML